MIFDLTRSARKGHLKRLLLIVLTYVLLSPITAKAHPNTFEELLARLALGEDTWVCGYHDNFSSYCYEYIYTHDDMLIYAAMGSSALLLDI